MRGATAQARLALAPQRSVGCGCCERGVAPPSRVCADRRARLSPHAQLHAWHHAIETTIGLLADLALSRGRRDEDDEPPLPARLRPLREEEVERELNALFDATFEHCAAAAQQAVDSFEPLLSACSSKLRAASIALPPRPDVFRCLAEGVHHRFTNVYSVLLVRYGLDVAYLENDAQPAPPTHAREVLEPSLMLGLIGWER
eukprot:1875816-Prymnesium_polylepis.1